jgi:hypothetical protein
MFAGCAFARSFWGVVGSGPPPDADVRLFYTLPPPDGIPGQTAPTFSLLCLWQLWKHRNGVVFRAQNPSLALLMRQCRETAHLWRVRLPEDRRADVDSWIPRFQL